MTFDFNISLSFWLNGKPFEPCLIDIEFGNGAYIISILPFGTKWRSLFRIGYHWLGKRFIFNLFWIVL